VRTAWADDPQLTVRRVYGPNPSRVVPDPHGRLPPNARLLSGDARRIVVTANGTNCAFSDVEVLSLPTTDGNIASSAILAGLDAYWLKAARIPCRVFLRLAASTVCML
jgi:riboflavin biosynthesis pyrimidine reductase